MLNPGDRASEVGKKLFEESVTNLKIATRRYARKQSRWITNRFLARSDREVSILDSLLKQRLFSKSLYEKEIPIYFNQLIF